MGDTSDNIPGVPGIGEKTAAKIIKEYHSIENAHDHIEEVKPARAKNNLQEYYEQAIMSKDLATIKKDCDISYDFKDAKIGTLFTKDAYQLFKELELKSLFKYFGEEEKEEETLEVVSTFDLGEIENVFASIKEEGQAALGIIGVSGNCKGLSLTWRDNTVLALVGGFVTEDYLKEKITELLKEGTELIVLDYKALLHFSEEVREYESQIQDVGIQAYLLNPLQSAYDYEDIARDYLRQMLPSRKEVCGKKALEEVFSQEEEKTVQMAAYLSYVPFHAYPLVLEKLREAEMEELYLTIERPTVATLYDMEKYGITVEKDALKEYGDQLVGRIEELEKNMEGIAGLMPEEKNDEDKDDNMRLVIRRTKSLIHEFYARGITLDEIAEKLNVTPEYLGSQFHKEVGVTFSTYMKEYRIQKAKKLLIGTNLKLYEVAEQVGYATPKYFSKIFKEVTGQFPAEYRKLNK